MTKPDIVRIRDEHAEAEQEHREWLSAIDRWRSQYETALELLREVLAEIVEQQINLYGHEMAIKSHELRLRHHELLVASTAGEEPGANGGESSSEHERLMAIHRERRQFHELLAKRKHDLIWRILRARHSLGGRDSQHATDSGDVVEVRPDSGIDETGRRPVTVL